MTATERPSEVWYSTHSTVVELPDGEYGTGPDLDVCMLCGALVGSTTRHTEWHEKGSSS